MIHYKMENFINDNTLRGRPTEGIFTYLNSETCGRIVNDLLIKFVGLTGSYQLTIHLLQYIKFFHDNDTDGPLYKNIDISLINLNLFNNPEYQIGFLTFRPVLMFRDYLPNAGRFNLQDTCKSCSKNIMNDRCYPDFNAGIDPQVNQNPRVQMSHLDEDNLYSINCGGHVYNVKTQTELLPSKRNQSYTGKNGKGIGKKSHKKSHKKCKVYTF